MAFCVKGLDRIKDEEEIINVQDVQNFFGPK